MKRIIYGIIAVIAFYAASCTKSNSQYGKDIDRAEKVMLYDTDSALSILDAIDPSELSVDSMRAKYHYLKAYGNMSRNHSMIGDSLISFAHNYFRGKDIEKDIQSGIAFAWYKFWVGDTPGAIALLDSIAGLSAVPDSIMVRALRVRTLLGAAEYQGRQLVPLAKRLYRIETDPLRKTEARYMLSSAYEYAGETDSAIYIIDELIGEARNNRCGDKHFMLEIEKAQLLTEMGRNDESDRLVGEIFSRAGHDNGAADYLHFQYAINALNAGDADRAEHHLALADSIAAGLRGDDDAYFRSYSNLLHAIIDFKQSGRIKLMHINGLNNRQNERFNRMKASQWESERSALRQNNRALSLKAESEHKTVIILLISLTSLLILAGSSWLIIMRRQRERENEERIEALQKMVDEYRSAPNVRTNEAADSSALRSIMLKQLGIIKMVAEAPTEQNREMLRRITSLDGNTDGGLVDWNMVFEMIDNLYSGFHSKLLEMHGELLNPKEVQIIVLMVAGFSTKEISVITGQTTSTIYVRKSSIRKKLGVPGKEDIIGFLKNPSRG
ncbi:MAG: LuxR C-terminal-related transcriptional regulator [Muribaculaceae bacterium]|nr:LuxR C-terminal-related transcriptional regulator [Muribaculaceae bacterium]